jgi:hypothetical protein
MKIALFLVIALIASPAIAGTLYRCVDAKGVASYQEQPCPPKATGGRIGYAPAVAPSKKLSWKAQSGTIAQQTRQRVAIADASAGAYGGGSAPTQGWEARQQNTQPTTIPKPRVRQDVVVAPPPVPQFTYPTDQYGNQYTQAPGSTFVQDQKTGKTCFRNGSFIHC